MHIFSWFLGLRALLSLFGQVSTLILILTSWVTVMSNIIGSHVVKTIHAGNLSFSKMSWVPTLYRLDLQTRGLVAGNHGNQKNRMIITRLVSSPEFWCTCSTYIIFYYTRCLSWKLAFRCYSVLIFCVRFFFPTGCCIRKDHRNYGIRSSGGTFLFLVAFNSVL